MVKEALAFVLGAPAALVLFQPAPEPPAPAIAEPALTCAARLALADDFARLDDALTAASGAAILESAAHGLTVADHDRAFAHALDVVLADADPAALEACIAAYSDRPLAPAALIDAHRALAWPTA
jgi:hypothetical protein